MPSASPLAGLRVLDFSVFLPGALLTQWLASLGARVIMIERPGRRHFLALDDQHPYYAVLRRGKKSIVLNLKDPDDYAVARALLRWADVLVEGFRPGVMERLNLGPETARAVNPRLVYVRLSGFGQTGPYRQRPGHDQIYQALAGLLSPWGEPPVLPPVQIADVGGGTLPALVALLAALWARERTGQGTCIDVSLYEGALAWTYFLLPMHRRTAQDQAWLRVFLGQVPAYHVYQTKDGFWIALSALEPHFWDAFCRAVGRPEWGTRAFDPDLIPEVAEVFRAHTLAEWLGPDGQGGILDPEQISVAAVRTVSEVLQDPHLRAREAFAFDALGYVHPRLPMRFDGQRPPAPAHVPQPNEHAPWIRALAQGDTQAEARLFGPTPAF
ncbi:MAG: CoA transferase [Chloroflexi bacterium]|nr:CoA transferase [Chloroflexota bacterium]